MSRPNGTRCNDRAVNGDAPSTASPDIIPGTRQAQERKTAILEGKLANKNEAIAEQLQEQVQPVRPQRCHTPLQVGEY
jgi:hypothetical protein